MSRRRLAMLDSMQNFASYASRTLHTSNAEDCRVPSKKLPDRKPPAEDLESVKVFRANIRALYKAAQNGDAPDRRITQKQFAKLVGMSLRTLANILSDDKDATADKVRHAATLRTIERAAKGFKVDTWQLLFPDFPAELVLNETLRAQAQEAVRRYVHASPTVRAGLAEMLPPAPRTTG